MDYHGFTSKAYSNASLILLEAEAGEVGECLNFH